MDEKRKPGFSWRRNIILLLIVIAMYWAAIAMTAYAGKV
jgi:hypothetical protein